jgi:hypothetical protein
MDIRIEIERSVRVPAPYARVQTLLRDLEGTIGRFPKLRKLSRIGDGAYLWEMETIGSRLAKIAHDVSYAAKYAVDLKKGELSWKPLPKHGNAVIEGWFRISDRGVDTQMTFRVWGELREVPVPLVYRLLAPPFIQGKFTHLVDEFLARTGAALSADARRPSTIPA